MYYQLRHNTNFNIVGNYPQINRLTCEENKDILHQYQTLGVSRREFLNPLPPLDCFRFGEEAEITDAISNKYFSANVGFLASKKLLELLKNCILPNIQFHDSKIRDIIGTGSLDYTFCYIIEEQEHIEYSQSVFKKTDFLLMDASDAIEVNSFEHFHQLNHEIQKTEPGFKLTCVEISLTKPLDIVRLPGDSALFISEKFQEVLIEHNISGFDFKKSKVQIKNKE